MSFPLAGQPGILGTCGDPARNLTRSIFTCLAVAPIPTATFDVLLHFLGCPGVHGMDLAVREFAIFFLDRCGAKRLPAAGLILGGETLLSYNGVPDFRTVWLNTHVNL